MLIKNNKNSMLTPEQLRERGRELLRLASEKEKIIENNRLRKIGEIFSREIKSGWSAAWPDLAAELEPFFGSIPPPPWAFTQGVQGGEASLAEGDCP